MNLFIFKWALPALLGYTLFFGIAGKLNPFKKPVYLEERPSWMLGVWTGLTVFLILSIGLHMAYGMTLEAARTLIAPSAIGMALIFGFGFISYSRYRRKILEALDAKETQAASDEKPVIDWPAKVHQLDTILEDSPPALTARLAPKDIASLQNELEEERQIRQETERHLRVTRKALANNALTTQGLSANQTPLTPEAALANRILNQDALNSAEPLQHNNLELNVTNLKRELVKTKQEVRLQVAARAKALSTANKSVAFARQSIELRARLETELEAAHAALANRHSTITSLISRLEPERRLTDDELTAFAKHVVVNDPEASPDPFERSTPSTTALDSARFTSGNQ